MKDMFAVVKNLISLTKAILNIIRRRRSIKEINLQIQQNYLND